MGRFRRFLNLAVSQGAQDPSQTARASRLAPIMFGRHSDRAGRAHLIRASSLFQTGDHDGARASAQHAVEAFERPDERPRSGLVDALAMRARVALAAGRPDDALADLERALVIARAIHGSETAPVGRVLVTVAELQLQAGAHEAALQNAEEGLRLAAMGERATTRGSASLTLARVHAARGDLAAAEGHARAAVESYREWEGDGPSTAAALGELGLHLNRQGKRAEAIEPMTRAVAIHRALDTPAPIRIGPLNSLGMWLLLEDRTDEALANANETLKLADTIADARGHQWAGMALSRLALLAQRTDHDAAAVAHFTAAIDRLTRAGDIGRPMLATCYRARATARRSAGDSDGAIDDEAVAAGLGDDEGG